MNEVEVVHARLEDAADLGPLEETLNDEERARARGYKLQQARDVFILARGLLRRELARRVLCPASELTFDVRPAGKPDLRSEGGSHPSWRFSVSHTGPHVAIAFSCEADVGVDIESLDRHVNPLQIASRYFTPHELSDLESRPAVDRVRAFLAGWTRKEAVVKARGATMAEALATLCVDLDPDNPHPLATGAAPGPAPPEVRLTSFEIPSSRLIGAVALLSPTPPRLEFRMVKCDRFD